MSKTTIPTGGITDGTIATGDIADGAVTLGKVDATSTEANNLKILEFNCYQKELFINEDYRSSKNKELRGFYLRSINLLILLLINFFGKLQKIKKKLQKS